MEKVEGKDYNKSAIGWLIAIYIFAVLGGLFGLIFGMMVYRNKVVLKDGTKVYEYKQQHRVLALIGAILSVISMIIWRVCTI